MLTEAGSILAASPVYQAKIAEAIDALGEVDTDGITGPSIDCRGGGRETDGRAGRFGG